MSELYQQEQENLSGADDAEEWYHRESEKLKRFSIIRLDIEAELKKLEALKTALTESANDGTRF